MSDDFHETIVPGAFKNALRKPVNMTVNGRVIAVIGQNARLAEDAHGLMLEIDAIALEDLS